MSYDDTRRSESTVVADANTDASNRRLNRFGSMEKRTKRPVSERTNSKSMTKRDNEQKRKNTNSAHEEKTRPGVPGE